MGLGFPVHSWFLPSEQCHLHHKSLRLCAVVGRLDFDEMSNFLAYVEAFEAGWARLISLSTSAVRCSIEMAPDWAADLVC